jgi:hypothetical protein
VSKNPFAVEKCNLNEKSKTSNIPYDKKQAIYNALTLTKKLFPLFCPSIQGAKTIQNSSLEARSSSLIVNCRF